ncbi:MAG: hypothetical protein GY950_32290 [bacterium]|nr:hypothetical protein [bacterium]
MKRTIKKIMLAIFMLLMMLINGFGEDRGERALITISGNYLAPADTGFKDIYSSGIFYPELKVGYKIARKVYVWVGYGFFSATGETPVLLREAKAKQYFLSGGLGYMFNISRKLDYMGELGVLSVRYEEESLGEKLTDSAIGIRIKNGLIYRLNRTFFLEISLGYLTASDTIENFSIKLGGLRTGLGLGVSF